MAIKSLDYDPFMAANNYEDSLAAKANKKASQEAEKLAKEQRLSAKRAAKLAEVEAKQKFYNRK